MNNLKTTKMCVLIVVFVVFEILSTNLFASAEPKGYATIYLYTPVYQHVMGNFYPEIAFDADIDGKDEKRLYVGSFVKFLVEPGFHHIKITSAGWLIKNTDEWKPLRLAIKTKPAEKYYVRLEYGEKKKDIVFHSMATVLYRLLEVVPRGVTDYEFSQLSPAADILKLIEAENVKDEEDEFLN